MDHDEDRNDNGRNQSSETPKKNEETGEIEHAFFQYRASDELFASDEESDESDGNASIDKSSHKDVCNIDYTMDNHSFSNHSDSVPDLHACNEKLSCVFDIDRQNLELESKDLATKFKEIILNDAPGKCLFSHENDSENVGPSPKIVNVFDHSTSRKNKRSAVRKLLFFHPDLSDYRIQNSEPSAEREEIFPMFPQASTSQHSNFSSHLNNAESSEWALRVQDLEAYSIVPSPTSSTEVNLEDEQSTEDHPNPNTFHRSDIYMPEFSMFPQASTSQHSNFSSHLDNAEPSEWALRAPDSGAYSIVLSPTSSTEVNLENAQSSEDHPNSNTSHRSDIDMPEFNSSSTSFDRFPNSPSTSFEFPSSILRRNLSRAWEHPTTTCHDIHCTKGCYRANTCLYPRSDRNASDESSPIKSEFLKLSSDNLSSTNAVILTPPKWEEMLLRSYEKPSTSTHDIFSSENRRHSNACASSCSKFRRKNTSSLSDLPNTSKISPQSTSPRLPQYSPHACKSARKLIFPDSDTSNDGSKENVLTVKENLVRKFSEKEEEPRKKRKTSHLSKSSENHLSLPETDDKIVSENTHLSPANEYSEEQSSKPKESESVSSALCSSETMNSEISEPHQSSRKRFISDSKESDSDESNVKSKQNKKLKQFDSSDEERI